MALHNICYCNLHKNVSQHQNGTKRFFFLSFFLSLSVHFIYACYVSMLNEAEWIHAFINEVQNERYKKKPNRYDNELYVNI